MYNWMLKLKKLSIFFLLNLVDIYIYYRPPKQIVLYLLRKIYISPLNFIMGSKKKYCLRDSCTTGGVLVKKNYLVARLAIS